MNHNLRLAAVTLMLLLTGFCGSCQPAPSPETFLQYPLGSHFTPHYRIVEYFRAVAAAVPDRVKLDQYGTTYEGRPLMLAFIASPDNMRRIESIRRNNLRLAGILRDDTLADEHAPVIVWLSYNVHGNEPSSSESAMRMLYELVDPASARAAAWLEHTIVVIDPCINPDGRDRYVHWFNEVVGVQPNPDPQSREHQEPWPRGRTNHYNFDLNRDWAWQTQTETQQRIKRYNAWLPQVHVDYHEQGYNNPYYFAPAAEPYHDVITPWQRAFQVTIGKNNARYFDKNGWLFYTKEEYDLFYPSYGDTYPIYNGAIGMTYEQGGIGAGLAVLKTDGDTLTLAQRIAHHFTTGVSTVEVASENAGRLIREFHQYFLDAVAHPGGEFKAYFLKADSLGDRLQRLKKLLDGNGIHWGLAAPGVTLTGIDYETGRTATFRSGAGDVVVNANQPKSNLLRVLFERQSHYSDSVTYDITAWSAPFAYGVQAYGLSGFLNELKHEPELTGPMMIRPDTTYAYAVRWTGMGSVRFLGQLLQKGIKVRYAETPFQAGGTSFDRGTLLVMSAGNGAAGADLWPMVRKAADSSGVLLDPISSGFVEKGADLGSDQVRFIRRPRVALLTGGEVSSQEAGEVWHLFEQEIGYPVTLVNAPSTGRMAWEHFDVVIMPDGNYPWLGEKDDAEFLKNWVREGGRLIVMQNALAQLAKADWGIRQKGDDREKKDEDKTGKEDTYGSLRPYGNRQREEVMTNVPGSIYRVELDNTHPLAFGYPQHYYTLKQDDKVYEFMREGGWNVGIIRKDGYVSGFTGNKAKEKIRDGLIFGVLELGRGQVIMMADDPLFRSFWENGKLLFCNAVFFVGQ